MATRDPFGQRRRRPGATLSEAAAISAGEKAKAPSAASLGLALAPDLVHGVGPVDAPPTPNGLTGTQRLGAGITASGLGGGMGLVANNVAGPGGSAVGTLGRSLAGAGSSVLGPSAGGLTGGIGGKLPKIGTTTRRGATGLGWGIAGELGTTLLGGGNTVGGGAMRGANAAGQLAIMAGRNPITSPLTAGVGLAEGIANTGWGNDLINAIRPDSMGDVAEDYGIFDTIGHVGSQLGEALGLSSGSDAQSKPDAPLRDRINQVAALQGVDPGFVTEQMARVDKIGAMYDLAPEMFADAEGNLPKREDVIKDAEMEALTSVVGWQDQQAAQEQAAAQQLAMQSFIGEAMRPYAQQTDQSGQMMAAAWKNYASGAPSWMQPYATFQAEQSAAQGKRLSAAYMQQAQMIPAMQQMDSVVGRESQIDQALWQMQMQGLTGNGAPATLDQLAPPAGG